MITDLLLGSIELRLQPNNGHMAERWFVFDGIVEVGGQWGPDEREKIRLENLCIGNWFGETDEWIFSRETGELMSARLQYRPERSRFVGNGRLPSIGDRSVCRLGLYDTESWRDRQIHAATPDAEDRSHSFLDAVATSGLGQIGAATDWGSLDRDVVFLSHRFSLILAAPSVRDDRIVRNVEGWLLDSPLDVTLELEEDSRILSGDESLRSAALEGWLRLCQPPSLELLEEGDEATTEIARELESRAEQIGMKGLSKRLRRLLGATTPGVVDK